MQKLTNIPTKCHFWNNRHKRIILNNYKIFEVIKEYGDCEQRVSDYREHTLLKCKQCGQLYLKEFTGFIDWVNGDDDQYWSFFPVSSIKKADELHKVNSINILHHTPWFEPTVLKSGDGSISWRE